MNFLFGEFVEKIELKDLEKIFDFEIYKIKKNWLDRYGIERLFYELDELGKNLDKFFDDEKLVKIIKWDKDMIKAALNEMKKFLKIDNLRKELEIFNRKLKLDYKNMRLSKGYLFHVGAGNVFVGAFLSLVQGLLAGNINIVKLSSADPYFLMEVVKLAKKLNHEWIENICILNISSKEKEKLEFLKKKVDAIAVYGSMQAVDFYSKETLAKVLAYGPKYGFAVVDRKDWKEEIGKLIYDIAMWDQASCSSVHCIFLDKKIDIEEFAEELYKKLMEFPIKVGELDEDFYVEVWKYRHEYMALNKKILFKDNITVFVDDDNKFHYANLLNRNVFITYWDDDITLKDLFDKKHYLQTAVLMVEDISKWLNKLEILNIARFVRAGDSYKLHSKSAHDGGFTLEEFSFFSYSQFGLEGEMYLKVPYNEEKTLSKINEILYSAKNHEFYREKLKNIKLPLKSLSEFKEKVPFTESSEVKKYKQKLLNESNFYLFGSGGTTDNPKVFLWDVEEFDYSTYFFALGMKKAGVKSTDIVANLFNSGGLWSSMIAVNRALEKIKAGILCIGSTLPIDKIAYFLNRYKPNCILLVPSLLAKLIDLLEYEPEKIGFAGEKISDKLKKKLFEKFKDVKLFSLGYAAVDTGPIGWQDSECSEDEFYPFNEYVYVEFIDDEIVVTNLNRKKFPIIRYKLNDRAKLIDTNTMKFKLLGRGKDEFIVASSKYSVEMFKQALEKIGLNVDFQIWVNQEERKITLNLLHADLKNKFCYEQLDDIFRAIYDALYEISVDFADDIEKGNIIFKINLVKEFLYDERTGKFKTIIFMEN